MPSTIFEDTLTNSGSSVMGGTRVLYVAWQVTVSGPGVHPPNSWDSVLTLGVGHWELGNDLTPLGILSGIAYGEPHWMNFEPGQWIAPPGLVGTEFSYAIAQYIQWSLSPGTEVHLYVFGDT